MRPRALPRAASSIAVVRTGDGAVVALRVVVADRAWPRLRGLLGRGSLAADEGLLLERCSSVHTIAMRFAIDAVFLDRRGAICRVAGSLPPWRMAACGRSCRVLELQAGRAGEIGLIVGDQLRFDAAGDPERTWLS